MSLPNVPINPNWHPIFNLSIERLHGFFQHCLNLLFPPICVGCQRMGEIFCSTCSQVVKPIPATICSRCGKIQTHVIGTHAGPNARICSPCQTLIVNQASNTILITQSRAAAIYNHPLRDAIHALKYENCREIAPLLARYLIAAFAKPCWQSIPQPIDAVIPIPAHIQRKTERGYNQAELLATEFCQHIQLDFRPTWVERVHYTQSQVGLNQEERWINVQHAFRAMPEVQGRTILLIDDLYTSGATFNACASAIIEAGGRTVYALALATPNIT